MSTGRPLDLLPEDQVKVRAEDAGVAGYLLKPYRKEVLLEVVRRFVNLRG